MSAAARVGPPRATRSKTFISRAPACHDPLSPLPFLAFVAAVEVGEKAVALARAAEGFLKGNELCAAKAESEIAWYNKGNASSSLGQYDQAVECYDRALARKPDYSVALYDKGLALAQLGRTRKALECYERLSDMDANNEVAWFRKVLLLEQLARIGDAGGGSAGGAT